MSEYSDHDLEKERKSKEAVPICVMDFYLSVLVIRINRGQKSSSYDATHVGRCESER